MIAGVFAAGTTPVAASKVDISIFGNTCQQPEEFAMLTLNTASQIWLGFELLRHLRQVRSS